MKITDSEIIKSCERELIDTIIGDLDWDAIEKIFKEKHHLNIQDDVEYRQGDLTVHNGEVAYKLDFDIKVVLSILFDRQGNYLSFSTSADSISEITPEVFDEISPDTVEDAEAEDGALIEETGASVPVTDDSEEKDADASERTALPVEHNQQDALEAVDENDGMLSKEPAFTPLTDDLTKTDADITDIAAPNEESSEVTEGDESKEPDSMLVADPNKAAKENMNDMASQIAEMISEINAE